jgi:hypothetical protein
MLNIFVNFDFCIKKKLCDSVLAHEQLVNEIGGHYLVGTVLGSIFMGVSHTLKIAIYVLKSAKSGLFYTPL